MCDKATNNFEEIDYDYGIVIEDVRRLLTGRSNLCIFFFFGEAKNVAHILAKHAISIFGKKMWIEVDGSLQIIPLVLKKKCTIWFIAIKFVLINLKTNEKKSDNNQIGNTQAFPVPKMISRHEMRDGPLPVWEAATKWPQQPVQK